MLSICILPITVECYTTEYLGPYTGEYLGVIPTSQQTTTGSRAETVTEADILNGNLSDEFSNRTKSFTEKHLKKTVVDCKKSYEKAKTIAIIVGPISLVLIVVMVACKETFDKISRRYGLYWNVYSHEDLIEIEKENRKKIVARFMEQKKKEYEEKHGIMNEEDKDK
uniref:Uncharacterized protein n=1 Tax=Syphacia muris TaxID=451379 RepID=A0A0N5AFF8_9BILA